MTAEVIHMSPAKAANGSAFADLLRRTKGGAARVLNRTLAWINGLLRATHLDRVVAFAGRWFGVAYTYAKNAATSSLGRWAALYALSTSRGRSGIRQVLSLPFRAAGWVLGKVYNGARTMLSFVHLESVIDVPVSYAIQYGTKAALWWQVNVAPSLRPGGRAMAALSIVSLLGMLRALRGFALPGFLARFTGPFRIVFMIFAAVDIAVSLIELVGDKAPVSVKRAVRRMEDWMAKRTPEHTAKVASERVEEHINHLKAVQDSGQMTATEAHKSEREMRVDAQRQILEQVGELRYAAMIVDEVDGVETFQEVMSKNEAKRILRDAGLPTSKQTHRVWA